MSTGLHSCQSTKITFFKKQKKMNKKEEEGLLCDTTLNTPPTWVCQVFCVSFYFQVADYYIVSHFFKFNNSHISGFVPVACHPWKAGCGQAPSLIQGGCSIFYTVPQRAGKALSLQHLPQGMPLSLWLFGNWNSPPLWRWPCTLFSGLHFHN